MATGDVGLKPRKIRAVVRLLPMLDVLPRDDVVFVFALPIVEEFQ